MRSSGINYSQCWEDPRLLTQALDIQEDDVVFSITSGGENTLELLLEKPATIISLDINPAQNHLFLLKLVAIQKLERPELLSFLGITPSSIRVQIFESKLKPFLEKASQVWWEDRHNFIAMGIIHAGKFEQFLAGFRRFVLPYVHSKKTVQTFISSPTLDLQQKYYQETFNSLRWKALFKLITSRFILQHFARQKGMFNETKKTSIAHEYVHRLHQNLLSIPIASNYFLHYCLTGTFPRLLPRYLENESIAYIKDNHTCINVVTEDSITYLKKIPDNSISKFNLSDIFEGMSAKVNEEVWGEILRTAKPGAKIAYWNNLVPRTFPKKYATSLQSDDSFNQEMHAKDRVFFYGSFHVTTVLQ